MSSRPAAGGMMGVGGMHPQIKQEMIDPTFEDLECKKEQRERDCSAHPSLSNVTGLHHQIELLILYLCMCVFCS